MCRTWFSPDVLETFRRNVSTRATLNLLRDRGFPIPTGKAQFFMCYAYYTRSDVLLQRRKILRLYSRTRKEWSTVTIYRDRTHMRDQWLKRRPVGASLKRVKPLYPGALWASKARGLYGLFQ